MSQISYFLARAGWALALVGGACLPELEQIQGEYVLYEHSSQLHPCAGNVDYLDQVIPFMADQLHFTPPSPLRFSWVTYEDLPVKGRHSYQLGLALGQHAWAVTKDLSIHELSHIVAARYLAPFFQEGIAVMFDDREPRYIYPGQEARFLKDPRDFLTAITSRDVDYATAALFVTFLLVRHGPDKFNEFVANSPWPYTLARFRAAFRRAYGLELDDEVAVFLQGIPTDCPPDSYNLQPITCSAPTIPWNEPPSAGWGPHHWTYENTLECDAPGVVGGEDGREMAPQPRYRVVTLELSATDLHYIIASGDPGMTFSMVPCFGCPWDEFRGVGLESGEMRLEYLQAGKYALKVYGATPEFTDFAVRVEGFIYPTSR